MMPEVAMLIGGLLVALLAGVVVTVVLGHRRDQRGGDHGQPPVPPSPPAEVSTARAQAVDAWRRRDVQPKPTRPAPLIVDGTAEETP